jgi:hypothetical protein
MKTLTGIKPPHDGLQYAAHGLNCFIVPKYLAARRFGSTHPDWFYLYTYLQMHFSLLQPDLPPSFSTEYLDRVTNSVLEERLGIGISRMPLEKDLFAQVKRLIDAGNPVLIPTDRSLFYHYPEKFGGKPDDNLLLLIGYAEGNGMLVSLDRMRHDVLTDPFFAPHGGGMHGYSPQGPRKTPLNEVIGDVHTALPLPAELIRESNESYNRAFPFLAEELQVMFPLPDRPAQDEHARWEELAVLVGGFLDDVAALLEPKFRLLRIKEDMGVMEQAFENQMVINSIRIIPLALRKIALHLAGPSADTGAMLAKGVESWKAWKKLNIMLSVQREGTGAAFDRVRGEIARTDAGFLREVKSLLESAVGTALAGKAAR